MATPEGTENYFKRSSGHSFSETCIRTFGNTGLTISAIGFGGYRIHQGSDDHAKALYFALLNGINLIDTSSNYTDGGSETLIGDTLIKLKENGKIKEDEVVIVSKAGYVQGNNLKMAVQRESEGKPFPGMVKYMEGCWHCIHPDFLENQLSKSLERLRLKNIDIFLLHNPEYYLTNVKKSAHDNHLDIVSARQEYYNRIATAFEWLEEKVSKGVIRAYGISSNTFPKPVKDIEFTSLEKVIKIADNVSSGNHFQVIQFPFNPFENGALTLKNQNSGTKSLLDLAQEHSVATMANRPLNAMTGKGMVRMVSFRDSGEDDIKKAFHTGLRKLFRLEKEFAANLLDKMPGEIPKDTLKKVFSLTRELKKALEFYDNWEHWDHVKNNIIVPQTISYLEYIYSKLSADTAWFEWMQAYNQSLNDFLDTISRYFEDKANARSKSIMQKFDDHSESLRNSENLSQKTLRLIYSTEGVDCTLLGMRNVVYVEDALTALREGTIPEAETVLKNAEL